MRISIETKKWEWEWESEYFIQNMKNQWNTFLCKIFGHKMKTYTHNPSPYSDPTIPVKPWEACERCFEGHMSFA